MDSIVQNVVTALTDMGIDTAATQVPDSDGKAWLVQANSVIMMVAVIDGSDLPALRLTCPILYMPVTELLPFYRRMLDINQKLVHAAFAMDRDIVCVISQQALKGVDPDTIRTLIQQSLKNADSLGDVLVREFPTARYWNPM
jgi:hypothetical protein